MVLRVIICCSYGGCDQHETKQYSIVLTTELPYRRRLPCGCWEWSVPAQMKAELSSNFLKDLGIPMTLLPSPGNLCTIRLQDLLRYAEVTNFAEESPTKEM